MTPKEIVRDHPHLTITDIHAAEAFAAEHLAGEEVSLGRSDEFAAAFTRDNPPAGMADPVVDAQDRRSPGFADFMAQNAGCSFSGGLYRIHAAPDIPRWTAFALEAFPQLDRGIAVFASDWSGRQFALNASTTVAPEPQCLMLDAGFGEVLRIPCTLAQLHESELVGQQEAALARSGYERWRASGGDAPAIHQCVGYRIPPFLGGADELANRELIDMEVYWSLHAQLLARIRSLPPRTQIRGFGIS